MKAVIIGAGVAGLGLGWRLRQRGVDVTILERGRAAHGASWAAAGMIAPAGELAGAGADEIGLAQNSAALWPSFAAELEQASGTPLGYRADGALFLDNPPPGLARLSPEETRARAPQLADDNVEAFWAPGEARVDSRALGEALAIAFERSGGILKPNEAVVRIERENGRCVARTPFGLYEADALVIAAGAWSGQLNGIVPIRPVKGQMIALSPPQGTPPPAGPVIWGNGIYAVPRGDRLLVGATVEDAGFDTATDEAAAQQLRARATVLIPELVDWTLAEHWAGLRPASPDGLPLLGPTATPGLYVSSGQYRNGILFAPAMASLMADMVLGDGAVIPAFDPRRFA